jgi:CHASE3 domain sensor protein
MNGLMSLSQAAHSGLTNLKGQSRILESEIKLDKMRGLNTSKKEKQLEGLNKQAETAQSYLISALEQDAENAKTFMDSVKETMDTINEEVQKREEEKAEAEDAATKGNAETAENNAVNETGNIVDIVIPSTIVTRFFSANNSSDTNEGTTFHVNVSA